MNALKIGVTGGIGVGKTTVCQLIEAMGYPVFYSDAIAKQLLSHEPELKKNIQALFGKLAYNAEGLNRKYIAKKAFENEDLLNQLNALVHPKVRNAFENFYHLHRAAKWVFNEAALLYETGTYKNFDAIILVTAPLELRIQRVIQRDHCSREEVLNRAKKQFSEKQQLNYPAFHLINNEDELLTPKLVALLDQIEKKIINPNPQ
jgi:dephospho-CoA kinase